MQTITSRFLTLNVQDFIKGGVIAVASAVVAVVGESFDKGVFTLDTTAIWHTAAAAAIGYLAKQLFTGAKAVTPAQ